MLSGILALVSLLTGGLIGFCLGWIFRRGEISTPGSTVPTPFFSKKIEKKKPKAFTEHELWERENEIKERGSRLNGA